MGRQSKQGETRATLSDIVARERQREEERRQVEAAKQGGSGKKKGEFQSLDVLQGYEERHHVVGSRFDRAVNKYFPKDDSKCCCCKRRTCLGILCVLLLLLAGAIALLVVFWSDVVDAFNRLW